jgi:uncharacterized protein (TIGR02231 family)
MKQALTSLVLSISFFTISAGNIDNEQRFKAPVESVVVYLDGAEVTHNKTVTLEAGRNSIVFTGISIRLISKSIQINAGSDVSILSISDKKNYLNTNIETLKTKQLNDSLKLLNETIEQLNDDKEAFNTEKKMLIENEAMGGREKAVSIAELKLAADFYRSRIKEINAELFKLNKKTNAYTEITTRLNKEINESNGKPTTPTTDITVLIASSTKLTVKIELKYLLTGAGWAPSYDLIAEDVNKPIELKYRAKVFNNTNVDWNNVNLKLSTANPTLNASKPQLTPWYLNFQSDNQMLIDPDTKSGGTIDRESFQSMASKDVNSVISTQAGVILTDNGSGQPIQTRGSRSGNTNVYVDGTKNSPVKFEQIQVSELGAEFDIKNTYTIPADAKPYIVEVTNYTLPATFKHYSVPKAEKETFLLARISGWEQLDLVEGPANVYFGGTYVGQSHIYTRSLDDTLDLSFGRDKKVMVSRTTLKEFNSNTFSGNNKKEMQSYEIIIKNNRKTPITIDVEDQLPVSQNSEIIVETIETSKAKKDDATGKLLWNYTIAPGEQQKITLTYSIKYPKNKVVKHKAFRTVSAPSF